MYTPIGNEFNLLDALLVTLISIVIVFVVLIVIIAITSVFSKFLITLDSKRKINPRSENKILDEDEDAVVATIVASMDFYNETKKHPRVVTVTRRK